MTDSIPCVGDNFPQTRSKALVSASRRHGEIKQQEAARLAVFAQYVVPATCEEFGLNSTALLSKRQDRLVSRPRKYLWWLLRAHPDAMFSFPVIGDYFRRDHTTVVHGVQAADHEIRSGYHRAAFHLQRVCNRLSFHGYRDWVVR